MKVFTDQYNIQYHTGKQVKGFLFIDEGKKQLLTSSFHRFEDFEIDTKFYSSREELETLLEQKSSEHNEIEVDEASQLLDEYFKVNEVGFPEERKTKKPEEVNQIRESVKAAESAFRKIKDGLVGMKEHEAVTEIQACLRDQGFQDAFVQNRGTALVLANNLKPHASPGQHVIKEGEMVIVDIGARKKYCSDLTRTYCRNPSQEQRELHETVRDVQQKIIERVEPGIKASKVKELEVEYFQDRGFSKKNILHSTVHGIGLQVHEPPSLSKSSEYELRPGNVFALEPALYLPGVGGCRIEDDVLVTEDGCERLSSLDRGLEI